MAAGDETFCVVCHTGCHLMKMRCSCPASSRLDTPLPPHPLHHLLTAHILFVLHVAPGPLTPYPHHHAHRYHCVRNSSMHPRFRSLPPLHTFMALGEDLYGRNQIDPLAVGLAEELG